MGRVFDGDPATLRQDNLPQCVRLLFFCFAIISPDIVLRCSDKLKKKQIFTFLVARVVYEPVVQPQTQPNRHYLSLDRL